MNILTNVTALAPSGGLETFAFEMSHELARRGHAIDVLYRDDGALRPEYLSFCRSVRQVREFDMFVSKRLAPDLVTIAPAVRAGVQVRPGVVYAQRFQSLVWATLTGGLTRSPIVCHLHGFARHHLVRQLASRVRRFIAVSHSVRDRWLEAGIAPDSIEVVHNGVDTVRYAAGDLHDRGRARRGLDLPEDAFVGLFYGRLDPEKGLEVLLEAWRQADLGVSAQLVIMGKPVNHPRPDEYLAELHKAAPRSGCRWLPMQTDVLPALYASDLVIVPSVADAFPRAVPEAMATGRPVVASAVGGIPEILTGPFERFLFEPGHATALARQITSLRGWRDTEPELADLCADHVRRHFSFAAMADRIERVLLEAAERK